MDALRRTWTQFVAYWQSLGLARRAGLVAAAVGVALAVGGLVYFSAGTSAYQPVYSNLALEDVAAMRAALTAATIPNELADGGTTITAPADRLAEARVALSAAGLPTRGGKGYELFDESSLTMTPFVQTVNYQRALQAELSRSVTQIEPVRAARVLVARPDPSPFVRDQRPTTASVVLTLRPGTTLSRPAAAAVVSLVARSVEGLKPENVTVVDSLGRLLSDPHAGERDDPSQPQLEYRRELEAHLANKAEEMLARHLGPGRAVVRVSADVNLQKMKERRESYTPDGRVAAAERLTTSKTAAAPARGVAGAASNVARAGATLGGGGGGGAAGTSEEVVQTDYLVSRIVQDTEDRMGAVTRLTVAAMIDLSAPGEGGTTISLADAQEIVKQAVGFRTGRDEIKLTNVRLAVPAVPELDDDLGRLRRVQVYVGLARNVLLALAVVLAVAMVPLALLRRRPVVAPPPAAPTDRAAELRRERLDRLAEQARGDPGRAAEVFGLLVNR